MANTKFHSHIDSQSNDEYVCMVKQSQEEASSPLSGEAKETEEFAKITPEPYAVSIVRY